MPVLGIASLLAFVSEELDRERALDEIVASSLLMTLSRHAVLAVMDDELGCLEIRHGASSSHSGVSVGERFPIDPGAVEGILGRVAATGTLVRIDDVWGSPEYRPLFPNTRSEVALPVKDRHDRVRAVLNIGSEQADAYSDEIVKVARALGDLIRIVLDRDVQRDREEALTQIGRALDSYATETQLAESVIRVANEVLHFQASSLFLLDTRTDKFLLRASVGLLQGQTEQIAYERGEGFTGWVCDRAEPILLQLPQNDPRWRGKHIEIPTEHVASFLAVPIVGRSGSLGAIRVLRRKSDNPYIDNRFTVDDLRLLQAIAQQVAAAVEKIRYLERVIHSERMAAWGELSAKSSHMIGNRMFGLKGDVNELGYLLKKDSNTSVELLEIQKSLEANLFRIEEILQDFRDFVTATQLVREPTNLTNLIQETVSELFPKRGSYQVTCVLEEIPILHIDGKKLRRAISELIENGLNHMEAGMMEIRTRVTSSELHAGSQVIEIEVADSGPGIDERQKGVIFQPFFSGRVKGMGLGLSIVKGIAEAHGGDVFERGTHGKGACFVIQLPLH